MSISQESAVKFLPESRDKYKGMSVRQVSLRENFSWTLLGNMIYAASQFGWIVLISRLGTPAALGEFSLGFAITAPIFIFLNLKLRSVQATDARGEFRFGHYLGVRIISSIMGLLAVLVVIYLTGHGKDVSIIVAVGCAKFIETMSDIYYGYLQQHEQMREIAISMIIKGMLSLMALGFIFATTRSVFWGIVGLGLAWLIVLLIYDIPKCSALRKRTLERENEAVTLRPLWEWGRLRNLIVMTLPLGVVTTLGSLNVNIPRYAVEQYLGAKYLGIFAALAAPLAAGGIILTALGHAATPRLAILYAEQKRHKFLRLLGQMIGIASLVGMIGVFLVVAFGQKILRILYGPEYAGHTLIFFCLTFNVAILFVYTFLGNAIHAMRQFKVQLPIHIVSALTILLLSKVLVPRFALMGGALACLGGSVIEFVAYTACMLALYRRWVKTLEVKVH
ncbi:oligosaccharide flippase family protein [Geothrix mesophila]|uniref:oligosaccharide flippase family protein n=1 Tax=Geothrix mesophila TaxID=2922723 RepID=UPI001FAD3568|nr:oligosaccharide flippase family protein [Geothrix sp. SG198]